MHNQISRKRREDACLELGGGRYKVFPIDVAGVNAESLKYESWAEYAVYEKRVDDFGSEYWHACEVPEWAALALEELSRTTAK